MPYTKCSRDIECFAPSTPQVALQAHGCVAVGGHCRVSLDVRKRMPVVMAELLVFAKNMITKCRTGNADVPYPV
jgi:hypothetical protein